MKMNHEDEMEEHARMMSIKGGRILEKSMDLEGWSVAVLQDVARLDGISTEDGEESDTSVSTSDRQVKAKRKRNEEPT